MEAKPADFYAQDQSGSTLEIWIKDSLIPDVNAAGGLNVRMELELVLSQHGSSRRQVISLNAMEFTALVAKLTDRFDSAVLRRFHKLNNQDAPNGFGHILDEPVEPVSGSTAETTRTIPLTPEAANQLAEKLLDIFEAEDAAKGVAVGDLAVEDERAKAKREMRKPWIVYDHAKIYCVIAADTYAQARDILKFQTGRFTFSLKVRESSWDSDEANRLPLHADWVRQMDAELEAEDAAKALAVGGSGIGDDDAARIDSEVA